MYDINNLTLDPLHAQEQPHDRAQAPESAASIDPGQIPTAGPEAPGRATEGPGDPVIMTLYGSDYRENAQNVIYNRVYQIRSEKDLQRALKRDHMAGQMVNNYRNIDNFMGADCIMVDVDNTHTEDPDKWKTADDIAEALPVNYYLVRSRNYMKPKSHTDKKTGYTITAEPREKWHLYLPLAKPINKAAEHERIISNILALFPYIDPAAMDPARFFFGVQEPHITPEGGECYIDEYINNADPEELHRAQEEAITEYTAHIIDGSYKDDRAARAVVKTVCELLKINNPLPDQAQETPTTPAPAADPTGDTAPDWMKYQEQNDREQWFLNWAQRFNVELGKRYTFSRPGDPGKVIAYCVTCPWEEEHTPGKYPENEAAVFIETTGRISFKCRHGHGAALNWKKYRAYYEAKAPQETPGQDQGQEEHDPAALPGLLTFEAAINIFETANDKILEFKSFPEFGKAAKIQLHDSVVLAADTGVGKSSLAINFMHDLSAEYPCMYFNLEMDNIDVLRRLTAIHTGIEINTIEKYKHDPKIAEAVNTALKTITEEKKPIQVIQGSKYKAYLLENMQEIIERSTEGREEPTIVFIDHSLLMNIKDASASRYERFTELSEKLRRFALGQNIILFILLQQSRAGKASEEERPKNSSLKESGSWENDSTQIVFLWYDPIARKKKLIITKNRHGEGGEFALEYWKYTQTYLEAQEQTQTPSAQTQGYKPSKRARQQEKLKAAYQDAYINTFGHPTLRAMAEAADVTTGTIKTWIKEYGGCTVDGIQQDPAGIDTEVEYTGFVKLTPADDPPQFDINNLELAENKTPKAGRRR